MNKQVVNPKWTVTRNTEKICVEARGRRNTHLDIYAGDASNIYPDLFAMPFGTAIPIRKPIIRFLERPTKACWWLSCDCQWWNRDYQVWTAEPTWAVLWESDDASGAVVTMCSAEFEAVYPKAKLRARTCKSIAPIKLVRI